MQDFGALVPLTRMPHQDNTKGGFRKGAGPTWSAPPVQDFVRQPYWPMAHWPCHGRFRPSTVLKGMVQGVCPWATQAAGVLLRTQARPRRARLLLLQLLLAAAAAAAATGSCWLQLQLQLLLCCSSNSSNSCCCSCSWLLLAAAG